jgi:hypothetical protein
VTRYAFLVWITQRLHGGVMTNWTRSGSYSSFSSVMTQFLFYFPFTFLFKNKMTRDRMLENVVTML